MVMETFGHGHVNPFEIQREPCGQACLSSPFHISSIMNGLKREAPSLARFVVLGSSGSCPPL